MKQNRRIFLIALAHILLVVCLFIRFSTSIGSTYNIDPFAIETISIGREYSADEMKELELDLPYAGTDLTGTPGAAYLLHLLFSSPAHDSGEKQMMHGPFRTFYGRIDIHFNESHPFLYYSVVRLLFFEDTDGRLKMQFSGEISEQQVLRSYIGNGQFDYGEPDPWICILPVNTAFTPAFFDFFIQ